MTANVDLTKLLKQLKIDNLTDSVIDEASLEIGALGSTAEKTDGALKTEYLVAGAEATISSPAVEGLTTSLGGVVDGLGTTLNTTLSSDGVLGTITSGLEAINIDLGLLGRVGVTNSKVALNGVDAALDQVKKDVLQGVISTDTGLVSIDLGTGDIAVDLSKVTTGGLNGKPENYELLTPAAVQEIADEVTTALSNLVTDLRDTLVAALDDIDIVVDLGLEVRLLAPVTTGDAKITGSVASFLGLVDTEPTTEVNLKLAGLEIGTLVTPLVKGVVGVVRGVIGPVLNPVVDGLAGTISGIVKGVTDPLEPVFSGVLDQIVEITLNEQGKTTIDDPSSDPDSTQEADFVTALSVTLLPAMGKQANKLSLARSEIRAEDEIAPVKILTPGSNATVPTGNVEVTGTGQAGAKLEVSIDGNAPQEVTIGEDGTWKAIFPDVPAGPHTVTATDNSTEASVSFTAEDESATDATTDASSDAQADTNADANADAASAADAEAGADTAGADTNADSQTDAETDGDTDGNYEPVGITSPKENSEVEGPSIMISGVSDPNAKVTVTVARVSEGAVAKAAMTDPQQQIDADDEGNWSVTVAGVEAGKYTAHAADGRTEDTTSFVVYDPSAESDSDSSATEGGSDSSATEGGSDSSATEGASDSSATEANASADGKDKDSASMPESDGKKDELADTGANGVLLAASAALMLALAGAGILFARRKKA